jgi:hypothetical protein
VRDRLAPSLPWSVEKQAACFVVRDGNGGVFAKVYYAQDPVRRAAAKLPTQDEAHRIAAQFAKLPDLLNAGGSFPLRRLPRWRHAASRSFGQLRTSAMPLS